MDHLPCYGRPPSVYFHAQRRTYLPEDFYNLPREYNYDFNNLLETGLSREERPSIANEFLQSWLFFALLAQVLGRAIDHTEFLAPDDTVHTRDFNFMLIDWAKRESEIESPTIEQKTRYIRASMALGDARRFVRKHCSYERMDRDECPSCGSVHDKAQNGHVHSPSHPELDDSMTLSLAILGETLQQARPQMVSLLDDRIQFWDDAETEETRWGYSKYCRKKLKEQGWCPRDIRRLESTIDGVSSVFCTTSMQPQQLSDAGVDHSDCNSWQCKANRSVKEPLHMPPCERCRGHQVPGGDGRLVEIIQSGKTPLVNWTPRGLICEGYDLKNTDVKFGALSHSWAEDIVDNGRDARDKNDRSMLHCQIESLQKTFDRLLHHDEVHSEPRHSPFWVDVLCLPRQASVKGPAINQIKDIYRKAEAVLVWDRSLLSTPKSDKNDTILMNMRIKTGGWSCRLWTFQETVLARNLHVAFQNGIVSTEEIGRAWKKAKQDPLDEYHHIWKAGYPFSLPIWKLRNEEENRVQRAWQAVQFRMMTDPEDETIILANVLGLDVGKIQEIDDRNGSKKAVAAKRMVKFLDLLDATPGLGIPSGIIFLPPPTLRIEEVSETRGYGWAPRTWLSMQTHSYPLFRPLRQTASIMKWGLQVEFPGLILHCPIAPIEQSKFWVPVHQSMYKWFKIVADTRGRDWNRFWSEDVCLYSEPSIIMCTNNPRERWEIGVLVRTLGKLSQGTVRRVSILCRVWVRLETNPSVITDLKNSVREHGERTIFGETLPASQRWCIDGDDEGERFAVVD